ncbi:MAG: zinc ribbon domain-containing protein [Polyangiaceae bacterium]|nr:zinc ribbon domain-containing protein [Polyangiaceae bacterium]
MSFGWIAFEALPPTVRRSFRTGRVPAQLGWSVVEYRGGWLFDLVVLLLALLTGPFFVALGAEALSEYLSGAHEAEGRPEIAFAILFLLVVGGSGLWWLWRSAVSLWRHLVYRLRRLQGRHHYGLVLGPDYLAWRSPIARRVLCVPRATLTEVRTTPPPETSRRTDLHLIWQEQGANRSARIGHHELCLPKQAEQAPRDPSQFVIDWWRERPTSDPQAASASVRQPDVKVLRGGAVTSIRALGFVLIALSAALFTGLMVELHASGLPLSPTGGGGLAGLIVAAGLVAVPILVMLTLGVRLVRLDRAAWVGQVLAGLVAPLGCAALLALGLSLGASLILVVVGLAQLLSLPVLLSRPVRWCFGIGPDAVLAEIDACEEVRVTDLAARFQVQPVVIEALLERCIALGSFAGAWDREAGLVVSVDTLLAREALRRCPNCGASIDALGNVLHCRYCGTEFAELSGLDYPMPSPIGVNVIAASDRVMAYVLSVFALIWGAALLAERVRPTSGPLEALAWLLFGGGPLVAAWVLSAVGRRLEAGRRAGWLGQMLLMPWTIPYLLRRRVRTLYAASLGPLRARFNQTGELTFTELAAHMGIGPEHAGEAALYLSASGSFDAIIDWRKRRLLRRDRLAHDGRTQCTSCGAPLRLHHLCAFCGTPAQRSRSAAPEPLPKRLESERSWARVRRTIAIAAFAVVALALGSYSTLVQRPPQAGAVAPKSSVPVQPKAP